MTVSFLPVFTLEQVEGRLFRPLALTKTFSMAAAAMLAVTLVPALMAVFNEPAWWLPRWLDRVLPDLDIEGDKLLTMLNEEAEAPGRQHLEVRN